jgi:hypothetical protein
VLAGFAASFSFFAFARRESFQLLRRQVPRLGVDRLGRHAVERDAVIAPQDRPAVGCPATAI